MDGPDSRDRSKLLELANMEQRRGRLDRVRELCRQILNQWPDDAEALWLLGSVALQSGRHRRAEHLLSRAVKWLPRTGRLRLHWGMALEGCGRLAEAVEQYKQCIAMEPELAQPYVRFGNLLKDNGQLREAMACYVEALHRNAEDFAALVNLGSVLLDLGRGREAVGFLRTACKVRPDAVAAWLHLGAALHDMWETTEAENAYSKALEIDPRQTGAMNNLGVLLRDQGRIRESLDWFAKARRTDPAFLTAHSNYLLTRHYLLDEPVETFADQARDIAHELFDPLTRRAHPHANDPDPDRRLRVGYLSGDFRRHAVSNFLVPLLANHSAENVEFYCYSSNPYDDGITDHLRSICDQWRDIRHLSGVEAAQVIRDDGIDVLVDLSGHSGHNRLEVAARRPAPVQAVWLGYFDTTGMQAMDYLLADGVTCPESESDRYVETVERLPECLWSYGPPIVDLPEPEPDSEEEKPFTFGCFNNTAKINKGVVDAWAAILRQVPGAELLLQSGSFADEAVRERYQEMFQDRGVGDRVVFRRHMELRGYLASYREVDVALDPFPYAGGATSADALWMGVPVVTLRGERFEGRLTATTLRAAGLQELVAADLDAYMGLAVELARDGNRLAQLRRGLRERMEASPLCDAARFARDMEAAYRAMWRRWCAEQG